jgi:hypothetical protein
MINPPPQGYSGAWQAGNIFVIEPPPGCPVRSGAINKNNEYGYNTGMNALFGDITPRFGSIRI